MRISVVLPEPDGPTMVKNSPSTMSRSMASTATWLPKRRVSRFSARMTSRFGGSDWSRSDGRSLDVTIAEDCRQPAMRSDSGPVDLS